MKKVLILAYDFPPYVSVGGLRPYNWFKFLKEFGVEPIVITRQWSNAYGNELDYVAPSVSKESLIGEEEYGTVIRAPYFPSKSNRLLLEHGENRHRFFRKSLTAFDEIRQFLWISGPKKQLYIAARKYLKENKVDAIIATGEPFVLFSFAQRLSQEFSIPWIADYRDPWSQNKGRQRNKLYTLWNRYLEQKVVKKAICITTASGFFKQQIEKLINNKTIYVLPNGYDPEVIEKVADLPQKATELTISFIGTIYQWHPWKSFLEQFNLFLQSNPGVKMQLNFHGTNIPNEVKKKVETLSKLTQKSIKIFPKTQNQELIKKLSNYNTMLLFNDYSIVGTKIYDYIGLKRKIILCYANDPKAFALKDKYYSIEEMEGVSQQLQADLLQKTNAGVIVEDESHLQEVFKELVAEFKEKGRIDCNSVGSENYSRKIQVEKLAEIIKSI
ncbi:glycosyltransferase [Brumimicrobium sp.]|uniref:glycosyltransferase n=1 Tax=Brumimicrobium sp. TaxID=2029867 RepID=UPI003A9390B3